MDLHIQNLQDVANKLRIKSIMMTDASKSGHPTSCASMAEITSVLFFHTMKYKVSDPLCASSDRFILSKGHAAPILYAAWCEAGLIPESELLNLRKFGNNLEGHPTPRLNFVDVATGSLGQGLGVAAGMAYAGKYIESDNCYRVFCLMGDGESYEGSVWEAAAFASQNKLDNLVAIVDVNRLGQSDPTPLQHDMEHYKKRWEGFGFNALVVDGHDVNALIAAFDSASKCNDKPSVVLAKTFKGAKIPGVENELNWHGKPLGSKSAEAIEHLTKLIQNPNIKGSGLIAGKNEPNVKLQNNLTFPQIKLSEPPKYKKGEPVATRLAYGTALAKLGHSYDRIVALDADVKNSTFSDKFKKDFPRRFVECNIAEQNMVSVAIGIGTRKRYIPFVSTFAAFLSRAYDQIRMGAISETKVKFCGSHVGVSIGEDGPSQMALEDIAMFRAIPGCVVFYPSDAVSAERAVELAANVDAMVYIRSSRPSGPVIYDCDEEFAIGKAKVCRKSGSDRLLIVAAGVTLTESLDAASKLEKEGINIRVLDLFTVKPIDAQAILSNAAECGKKVLSIEDHYPEGGLCEAVASVIASDSSIVLHTVSVNSIPRSGSPSELLDYYCLSAEKIYQKVKSLI